MKKLPKLSKKVKIIIGIVLVLVIAIVAVNVVKSKKQATSNTVSTAKVEKGDVVVEITGSGTIEANEQYEITSLVTGDVLSANFEEGDILNKGDVMYKIDTSNMENSIAKSKNSLEKSQMSYEEATDNASKLNVVSPVSGTVTEVGVKKGDSVQSGSKIIKVTDDSTMVLKIPFNSVDANQLYIGCPAQVTLDNNSYTLNGTVAKIATGLSTENGVAVKMVQINVSNPGTVKDGDRATAVANGVACNNSGSFEVNESQYVTAKVGGDVSWIAVSVGDKVRAGQKVAQLSSDSVNQSVKSNRLSVTDASLSLDNLYDQLDDYTITAPISGTVVSKTTKAGDKLDNTNAKTVMAMIADLSVIKFDISVDELDISKIKLNQEVSITADALDGKKFSGFVSYVSIVGTTENGVTTYPITVTVNEPEGLIPGMNVDATIVVEQKKDVLVIPVSAINRGNTVYVKDDSVKTDKTEKTDKKSTNMPATKVPDGFKAVKVELGLNNSDVAEVISGLKEGQEVKITVANAPSVSMEQMMRGGGMGGPQAGGQQGGQQRSGAQQGGQQNSGQQKSGGVSK